MKRFKRNFRLSSETRGTFLMLKRSKLGMLGLAGIITFSLIAIFGPFFTPYDPIEMHYDDTFLPPSSKYLLGTDEFGRDVLSRMIYGARVSFSVSVVTVGASMFIGVLLGSFSGYCGGKVDFIIMRFVDIFNCFPLFLLALGIMAVFGRGLGRIMVVLPMLFWISYARVTRGLALYIRQMDYIEVARSLGSSGLRTVFTHVLPNVLPSCIVIGTFQLGSAIIAETSLSFIGFGIQPPLPSWGSMLTNAREYILKAPYLTLYPGLAISFVILAFNLLGDALRDALDPRLRT